MKWLFLVIALSGNPHIPHVSISSTVVDDEATCDSMIVAAEKFLMAQSLPIQLTVGCSQLVPVAPIPEGDGTFIDGEVVPIDPDTPTPEPKKPLGRGERS